MKTIYIIDTKEKNVYKNLAFETLLINECNKTQDYYLFFWENNRTVIIGKNQNPYTECDINYTKENKIKIARRITGGGTVYHTSGNINFSIILPNNYTKKETTKILLMAFKNLGFNIKTSGRNDLLIENKKFSGSAYYKSKNSFLHHGTILINMNIENINKILTPNKEKLLKNSVKSVNSRIINLKNIDKNINKNKIKKAIAESFKKNLKYDKTSEDIVINKQEFEELYKKYKSKKWIYSNWKNYKKIISKNFNWGIFEILKFNNNYKFISDSIFENVISLTENSINENKNINLDILTKEEQIIASDILNFFKKVI